MTRLRFAAVAFLVVSLLPSAAGAHAAAPAAPRTPGPAVDDVRELPDKHFDVSKLGVGREGARHRAAAPTPAVGTVREWLGLNEVDGGVYRKDYTLRSVGKHIEVWVATDVAFPKGDCRPASSTQVTDAQIGELVTQFDDNIWPRETAAFSTPRERDGTDPQLTGGDYTGDGAKTVTLLDNVRDDNYFDFPKSQTYVAGFFSSQIDELVDRNVMTIDVYDWKHRSGANPPDEPTDDVCTSRPARPRMYEGTFAHEWQHLLQSYTDPDEELWVNEGLSDYAQTLVGYVDGTATVHHAGTDSHLNCFQGFGTVRTRYNTNPRPCGGAQNSLNLWDEGDPVEVLADYGNAYQFMLYLKDRFGAAALSRLHRDGAHHGLAGVSAALGDGVQLYRVLHDFQTMTLVDKIIDDSPAGTMVGVPKQLVTAPSLRSTVNLDNPSSYDDPGAAPNGADYVRLRGADGKPLRGSQLKSVRFTGARTLPTQPLQWTVKEGALFSGNTGDLDASAVLPVTVPATDPTLRVRQKYSTEVDYDYGYVTVSTDGGHTYKAVAGDKTVTGPLGPAINGESNGFATNTYDLSAYAGKRILLGFRYVTDQSVNEAGWFIDDATLGGATITDGSTLAGFRSPTQIVPQQVHAWSVRLIGLDTKRHRARRVPLAQFAALKPYPKVVAVIAYDEPTGMIKQYAPYTLTVNDVLQPGGATP